MGGQVYDQFLNIFCGDLRQEFFLVILYVFLKAFGEGPKMVKTQNKFHRKTHKTQRSSLFIQILNKY
jgi:hypothetical protein